MACSSPITACSLMHTYVTDDVFNAENTCIVLNQNSLSYRNFGRCFDIVEKYPYGDVAGLRKPDKYMKMYAQYEDFGQEGECVIKSPPHYKEGPTIATLITQFGIGRPIEDNNIAKKIVNKHRNKDLVQRLSKDSCEQRGHLFSQAMFRLGFFMSLSSRDHIKNIIIPSGIARSGEVDDIWLTKYLPVIHKFSIDMENIGKRVIILLSQTVRQMLEDQFKNRVDIKDEVMFQYKTLIGNLPLIDNNNFNCKKNEDSDCEIEDYPNAQMFF